MLNRQHDIAARAFQFTRKVGGHDIQGRERFTGVTEQGLSVDVRHDGEDVADRVGTIWIAQARADQGFGDLGEFGDIDRFVDRRVGRLRGMGGGLFHVEVLAELKCLPMPSIRIG